MPRLRGRLNILARRPLVSRPISTFKPKAYQPATRSGGGARQNPSESDDLWLRISLPTKAAQNKMNSNK